MNTKKSHIHVYTSIGYYTIFIVNNYISIHVLGEVEEHQYS